MWWSLGSLKTEPGSNIRGGVHEFIEQHAGRLEHLFDLVRRLGDRPRRGVDHELSGLRRLVVVADAGERRERAGAGLFVVALGVALLANFRRRRDVDLAERSVGDAARGGAVLAGGRDGGDTGDVAVAGEMRRDFGEAADVLAAIGGGESKIAVEPGAQRVAVEQDR